MSERISHPRDYEAESWRHRILWMGGAAVLVLAIIAYFVLRDDGEENRDAYRAELSDLVTDVSLDQAVHGASKADIERITSLAPAAVEPAWNGLSEAVLTEDPTPTQQRVDATKLQAELDKITEDADDKCDLTLRS
jgi:hypothetical protein